MSRYHICQAENLTFELMMFDLGLDNAIKHACLCHLIFISILEISMFKRNQIQKTLLVSTIMITSAVAIAQETVTSQASITVQNAFNLTEVAPLSFGTVTVSPGDHSYLIQPDGVGDATPDSVGTFSVIVPGTNGQYTVDGAAAFTDLTIESTTTFPLAIRNPAANQTTNGSFSMSDITFAEDGTAGAGTSTSATVTTDVNGGVVFNMGATLSVVSTSNAFVDGTYVGNYTLQVSY